MKDIEKIVFVCDGGIGKCIASTAVVRNIKKKHPDKELIVIAGYPAVFMYNPNVNKVYAFGNPLYFYEDQIINKKTLILKSEPYLHYDYLQKTRHLIDVWCEQCGVELDEIKPDLYFTNSELTIANAFIKSDARETIIMHVKGGSIPQDNNLETQLRAELHMYRRNLPDSIAQEVVDKLQKYRILQIKGNTQTGLKNVQHITTEFRQIMALAQVVNKFIVSDSFVMHTAAAFDDKKVVAIWGGTNPKVLGYEKHINLTRSVCPTPFCHRPNDYLWDISPNNSHWDCPHGEPCLKHDSNEIVKHILN